MAGMKELAQALKVLLADEIVMSLKAQGFHWNVEGVMFHPFHGFFAMIYEDVQDSIDPTAENIRKLGEYPPFTLPSLQKLRTTDDKKGTTDPVDMCVDLHDANEAVLSQIDVCFKLATAANEQGIADFLAGRDGIHKKWRWQLEATIKR